MKVAAAGKVFLAGEYAVLTGAPALVAGVDRALHAEWNPSARLELFHRPSGAVYTEGGGVPAELRFARAGVDLALRLCREEGLPERPFTLTFEDDFTLDGRKVGLGGSAAATALSVEVACAAQGRTLAADEHVALAAAAHWAEQGGSGSGGDVAASVLGGVLQVRTQRAFASVEDVLRSPARSLASARPLQAARVAVPADLRLVLLFTGASADSRALVRAVNAFAGARPHLWQGRAREIAEQSTALAAALASSDREAALQAVRDAASAMAALGEAAGVGIVTPELARACALAASAGAAAKPSGAGGGDCAVALCFGDDAAARLERACLGAFPTLRVSPAPARERAT